MSRLASRFLVTVLATLLATGWLSAHPQPARAAGTISLATLGTAYTQDFATLSTLGTANSLTINGWELVESGGSSRDNELYAADTGASNTGDTYSYGPSGNSDRAFGGLRSGTLVPTFGASFTNNTGSTIGALAIAYRGEMWRAGVTNRGAADRLDFQLSTDATSLTTGAWTSYDDLDFNSPNLAATAGALVGNNSENYTDLSYTVTGLSIANGGTFWIRWTDFDISSSDDGLAVDDFSLTPNPATSDEGPSVTSTAPADGQENIAADSNIQVDFSEAVDTADPWYDIECTSSGSHTATVSGAGDSRTLDPDTDFTDLEHCTVTVDAAGVTDADSNDPPDNLAEDFAFTFQVGPECDDTFTPIYEIQGAGDSAAVTGNLDTEGVVVGDFEG
ncbi:MAG TPA: Ig-like domain-containing protein, partial [Candidatus Limnocylindrales bacterium]|nr:Ig-like domain-containing protein [Candidatus Limnocylindrales bacterium]